MIDINKYLNCLRDDFLELHQYDQCYHNALFDHLTFPFDQDFIGDGENRKYVPIERRKPLIKVPIGKQVVETVVSYTFGKGNFPKVQASTMADLYKNGATADVNNAKLQRFVNALITKSFLPSAITEAGRYALAMKKCIVYFKYVYGKPVLEVLNYKWVCNEVYDPRDNRTLISFDYRTLSESYDENGKLCTYWNCRRFDKNGEYTYLPIKAEENVKPEFKALDQSRTYEHELGFCPAVMMQANREDESIFESQIDNIKQYSYFVSVIVMGMRKNVNPQRIWMGENPPTTQDFIRSNDSIWQMPEGKFLSDAPNPQSYLYALDMEHRLREIILRGSRVVEIPNENYQSGEALKMKIAPELNLVQETRTELGDRGMVELIMLMVQVTIAMARSKKMILDESGDEIEQVNEIYLGPGVEIPDADYEDIDVSLGWGEIFIPTAQSKNLDIQTAVMAVNPESGRIPLFSMLTARNAMSSHFNVVDMSAEQMQIEREKVARLQNMALEGIIQSAIKSDKMDVLIEMVKQLATVSNANMPYEYNVSQDYSTMINGLAAMLDDVDEAEDDEEEEDKAESEEMLSEVENGDSEDE
jgi:hypothetical protein